MSGEQIRSKTILRMNDLQFTKKVDVPSKINVEKTLIANIF